MGPSRLCRLGRVSVGRGIVGRRLRGSASTSVAGSSSRVTLAASSSSERGPSSASSILSRNPFIRSVSVCTEICRMVNFLFETADAAVSDSVVDPLGRESVFRLSSTHWAASPSFVCRRHAGPRVRLSSVVDPLGRESVFPLDFLVLLFDNLFSVRAIVDDVLSNATANSCDAVQNGGVGLSRGHH